jgi:general secretion pathway protein F
LPEALRLAADGVHDANMSELSRDLAARVEEGSSLSELIATTFRLPPTLAPIVLWGEQAGDLSEAFRRAGEMFEGRVQMRAALVRTVLPPLIFIAVAITAVVLIFGLYAPLITMIQGLY